jgi:rhodanese-related sulfurtransferase
MRASLFAVLTGLLSLSACSGESQAPSDAPVPQAAEPAKAEPAAEAPVPREPEVVSIEKAEELFATNAVPVDANSDYTRKEMGVIPGAALLTSSSKYDCDAELPKDKATPLVFYCGNDHCSASDAAAERAMAAGHENVKILRAGIAGWKDAGKKTEQPAS